MVTILNNNLNLSHMNLPKTSEKIPELAVGVRNLATLSACKDYADAVYFSVDRLSLRSRAQDITLENLNDFADRVREYDLRSHLAVNSVIYPDDMPMLDKVIEAACNAGVDAVIAWDPAAIRRAVDSGLKVHISTQANVSNWETAEFYGSMGASRVVLSRELSLEQIRTIRENTDMELEVFVHGAMCQSISGRCYLSAYILGKSGNCGQCAQPCRWQWTLQGEDGFKIDLEGKYLLSAKDICMVEYLPELIATGIDSLKVEGRLRNPGYAAAISRCYREALDSCRNGTYTLEKAVQWKERMSQEFNRGFSTGFYFGIPGPEGIGNDFDMNASTISRRSIGIVTNYYPKQNAAAIILQEGGLNVGDEIIIEGKTTYIEQTVESLLFEGNPVVNVEKGQEIGLAVNDKVRKNDRVFKVEDGNKKDGENR